MKITETTKVGDVVASEPRTSRVLERHAIDFCCGGKRPLKEACEEQGVSFEEVALELEALAGAPPQDAADWLRAPLPDVIAHIVTAFHGPLRDELPRLERMADKVLQVHGRNHPGMLRAVTALLKALKAELEAHMLKEEQVLFPWLVRLAREADAANGAVDGGLWRAGMGAIAVMEEEHESAGIALAELRRLTSGYRPPEGACGTFIGLFAGLAELEEAMHVHIHLENNVLFPRAAALADTRPAVAD